ncbi:MAG: AI-2E family transporter [Actinomycetes bacterium]
MTTGGHSRPLVPWLDRWAWVAGRFLVVLLAVAAILWMALQVKVITTAAVIGFAVVSMLWPVARWLRTRKVPAALAAIMSVVAFLAIFALIGYFVVARVVASLPDLVDAGTSLVNSVGLWASNLSLSEDSVLVQDLLAQARAALGAVLSELGSGALSGLNALGNLATVFAVAVFFSIFALTGGDHLWRQFVALLPQGSRRPANDSFQAVMKAMGGWLIASTLTGLIDGLFIGVGLLILGVPLAVPIGALTFVLGYIPLVGATLAGAIAVAVAFVSGGWTDAVWALLIVLAVQQIEGNILSPLLLSRAVNFPPLVTLLLTTGAGIAFGIVGIFLAVPVVGSVVAGGVAYHRGAAKAPPELSEQPSGQPAGEAGDSS